jgi:hypothetical protein
MIFKSIAVLTVAVVVYFAIQQYNSNRLTASVESEEREHEYCRNFSLVIRRDLLSFANRSIHLDSFPLAHEDSDRRYVSMLLQRLYAGWPSTTMATANFTERLQFFIDVVEDVQRDDRAGVIEPYNCMQFVKNATLWIDALQHQRLLNILRRLEASFHYVDRIKHVFNKNNDNNNNSSSSSSSSSSSNNSTRIVVAGAGPVGLAHALELYRQGYRNIVVFDRRLTYTRNIWFDLYSEPVSLLLLFARVCF